jgi:hypothetical protein
MLFGRKREVNGSVHENYKGLGRPVGADQAAPMVTCTSVSE